jgi:TonB family protein
MPHHRRRSAAGLTLALLLLAAVRPAAGQDAAPPVTLTPPRVTHFVEAPRPEGAGPEGAAVELELTIAADGTLTDAKVVGSASVGGGWDAAALAAVQQFTFEPARKGDKAVPARIRYRYTFDPVAPPPPPEPAPEADGGAPATESVPQADAGTPPPSPEAPLPSFGATASVAAPPREVTKHTLNPAELTLAAGTRGDALRVVELLPGVARSPGLNGFLVIRGAGPQDSQVYFEGGPVDRLYHFGGITSFTQARLLERIDLYPGNFSARYGRKIGGVVDVGIRDPRRDGYHGMLDINMIDASFLAEGPVGERGAIAIAAKRSYVDLWLERALPADAGITAAPVYSDYQILYTYRAESGSKLRVMLFGSDDSFKLSIPAPVDGDPAIKGSFSQATSFHRLQATWKQALGERIEQELTAGIGTLAFGNAIGAYALDVSGFDAFARLEWRWRVTDAVKLVGGFDGYAIRADVGYFGPRILQQDGNPRFTGPLASFPLSQFNGKFTSLRPAGYVEALINVGERLLLVPGVRADSYTEANSWSVEPRFSARLRVAEKTTLKGGVGLYSQPPQYGEAIPDLGNPNLGLSRAQHYGLGVEQLLGERARLTFDTFYKRLSDLQVAGVDAQGRETQVNGGKGRIYGLELMAKLNQAPGSRAFGFLSYTLSRSERNDHGLEWRLFDFDQTHILSVAAGYKLPRNWNVSGTFRLVSGNPTTPVVGAIYDANSDYYLPLYGRVNSVRNPVFHQLSVRIEKLWPFQKWQLATYLDVQNAYNHRSQEGIQYSYDYTRSAPVLGLPVLPSLGVRGEF